MTNAVIIDGVRTPVGRRGGALAGWHPTDLLAQTLQTLVDRTGIDSALLDDVIVGCALTRGEQGSNFARYGVLAAGLPESLPATTIDRQCGSGQQAVHFAAQAVRSGDYRFAIAAGVDSMSRVPLGELFDPSLGPGPWYGQRSQMRYHGGLGAQGPAAEAVIQKWGLTREELDDFSAESHRRADAATEAGFFADHLVGIDGLTRDEGIRSDIDRAKMWTLRTVFADDGAITAANSSQISDGAAALLIADEDGARTAGLRPKAAIRAMTVAADDPVLQFTAVLPAARSALDRAGLSIEDIDRVEVNEAFACVPVLFAKEFRIGFDRLNVNGGSIAIGHPLGSTGARMMTDLVYELHRSGSRYGMLTICEGGGMANCTIIERIDG
ncbi:acetyl-CoA acetyltransferase [Mycobacterium antarcticum]|uniref:thiolase family protein n=1 Tax=Mycolicibacterium sp. TUM20983 TaxID=3023369 RepID=UPI00238F0F3A|nr:thiolase family protein [Mycolicibacterium sp. TUM20983]GLP76839.1 acetyl-CoA acetyltransferase [Mycolicibacterium sp. TUM20983]